MTKQEQGLQAIAKGMQLAKCRRCGCMAEALVAAAAVLVADKPVSRQIAAYRGQMEPIAYNCLGCKRCWGAEAQNALEAGAPTSGNTCKPETTTPGWPAVAGEYVLGNSRASVAVCTLGSEELVAAIIAAGAEHVAIAGKCETENIGVEKVVLNTISNPRLRILIVCGNDTKGHRAGDALLRLKEQGVDTDMRVLESAAWRPVLRNLTLAQVARFREQVELVNLVGQTEPARIAAMATDTDNQRHPSLPAACADKTTVIPVIARAPKRVILDPAGFFVIILDRERAVIVCEHYLNDGRQAHVVEGRDGVLVAATLVEQGWVTRLDHAAYLGRELQKAQYALVHGLRYVQDAVPGEMEVGAPSAGCCGEEGEESRSARDSFPSRLEVERCKC